MKKLKIDIKKVAKVLMEFSKEDLLHEELDKKAAESLSLDIEDYLEDLYLVRLAGQIMLAHNILPPEKVYIAYTKQILEEVFGVKKSVKEIELILDIMIKSYDLEIESTLC